MSWCRTYHAEMIRSKKTVLVAMSGGVDSSVAAAILLEEGYEVVGCFMRLGSPGDDLDVDSGGDSSTRIGHRGCCSIRDATDARIVAGLLDIPFYVCNFKQDFARIIDYFVEEYDRGRTPNPCVRCNDWLKFGRLHDYARGIGADYVASGHYARIKEDRNGVPQLLRGVDRSKDQSYVLFGTPRAQLSEMLLPIGGMEKSEVRDLAARHDLPVSGKPDSQEICFVPDDDYAGLVEKRSVTGVQEGPVLNTDGEQIGHHPGHQHFTIGQRRGVGIALGHPIYVIEKHAEKNAIVVGRRKDLDATGCRGSEANWFMVPEDDAWISCEAKIRYNAQPVPARVRRTDEDAIEVRFEDPQYAVAPGQAVVCYEDDAVICGAWITASIRS